MGVDDIVHVREVDAVVSVAYDSEFADSGSFEYAGHEVGVVVSPDQVGAQGDCFEVAGRLVVG